LSFMGEGRYFVPNGGAARSAWAWRGFLAMSILALGVTIVLLGLGLDFFAILWLVIALGWFGVSLWRRRMDVQRSSA
jgi:hypothetical protein